MRALSAIAGSIVIAGALGVAIAQSAATVESVSPKPAPGKQEMTAGQMLNYMKEQGTKYIVETTEIPAEKKFQVNLNSTQPDEVAKAVALALDLKAVKEGNVWIFKQKSFDFNDDFAFDFDFSDLDPGVFEFDDNQLKKMNGKEWEEMSPQERAEFERAMEKFGKSMEKFGEKMGQLKIELKGLEGKNFDFDTEAFKDFKGKEWKDLTPEEKAKLEKEMAELRKSLRDMKVEIKGFDSEEFKRDMQRMKEEIKESLDSGFKVKLENTEKLLSSITTKQWELMKSQGHLKLSDLTNEQRELLGSPKNDGDFNITIQRDGKKLVIKN